MMQIPKPRAAVVMPGQPRTESHAGNGPAILLILLLLGLMGLVACGGGGARPSQLTPTFAGNWQFNMAPPSDNSFQGGLQGGFLLQNGASVTGAVVYSVYLPPQSGGTPTLCSGGSTPITGTVAGPAVTLTATIGAQTFALTGTLSSDSTTILGTYSSTDGQGCGTAQTGLQWSATWVPPLTGTVQGNFHSVLSSLNPTLNIDLRNQDFPVSGFLTQGENLGASNATVTGTLNFEGYPCLTTASVNGQISGSSVILQIIAPNGSNAGQIGAPIGYSNPSPATFVSSSAGAVLKGTNSYGVTSKNCPGGTLAGDIGNVCLALGNTTGCTQPITFVPASISFPPQQVGSEAMAQTVTLTNSALSGTPLTGLMLSFNPQAGTTSLFGPSDFDGVPNYIEQDTCATSPGAAFTLAPQQSCTITISFSPQESCAWLPSAASGGVPPPQCPRPLTATLTVNSPTSADDDTAFAVPITGSAFSAIVPSTPEIDFGAEALGETSATQLLSFTNQGANPVQILPVLSKPCVNPVKGFLKLHRPLLPGSIAGLQVDTGSINPDGSTISYNCDSDLTSKLPNFQISSDNCSGVLLAPLISCSIELAYSPQPATPLTPSLDYFLELNTLECTDTTTTNCEIDSGRFPVELTANLPSPLRMTPGAGLDFGPLKKGQTSLPLTISLFNDPSDPNAQTINFTGNLTKGDFTEIDDCGVSLAPGGTCTLTITFQPRIVGFDQGTTTITYTVGQTQTIHLRGIGQ
jgi:hypothetical protein